MMLGLLRRLLAIGTGLLIASAPATAQTAHVEWLAQRTADVFLTIDSRLDQATLEYLVAAREAELGRLEKVWRDWLAPRASASSDELSPIAMTDGLLAEGVAATQVNTPRQELEELLRGLARQQADSWCMSMQRNGQHPLAVLNELANVGAASSMTAAQRSVSQLKRFPGGPPPPDPAARNGAPLADRLRAADQLRQEWWEVQLESGDAVVALCKKSVVWAGRVLEEPEPARSNDLTQFAYLLAEVRARELATQAANFMSVLARQLGGPEDPYPSLARALRFQASVRVRVYFDESNRAARAEVVRRSVIPPWPKPAQVVGLTRLFDRDSLAAAMNGARPPASDSTRHWVDVDIEWRPAQRITGAEATVYALSLWVSEQAALCTTAFPAFAARFAPIDTRWRERNRDALAIGEEQYRAKMRREGSPADVREVMHSLFALLPPSAPSDLEQKCDTVLQALAEDESLDSMEAPQGSHVAPSEATLKARRLRLDTAVRPDSDRTAAELAMALRINKVQEAINELFDRHPPDASPSGVDALLVIRPDGTVASCKLRDARAALGPALGDAVCRFLQGLYFGRKADTAGDQRLPVFIYRSNR